MQFNIEMRPCHVKGLIWVSFLVRKRWETGHNLVGINSMQPLKSSSTPEAFPRNGIKHISPQDLIFQMWRSSRFFQSAAIHRDSARTILGLFQWGGELLDHGLQQGRDCRRESMRHKRERERGSSCKCMPFELAAGVASKFSCRSCKKGGLHHDTCAIQTDIPTTSCTF